MFERFTPQARHVILSAQEEARRLEHDTVGTGHILLAVLREGDASITAVFQSLSISPAQVRTDIEGTIGHGEGMPRKHGLIREIRLLTTQHGACHNRRVHLFKKVMGMERTLLR